MEQFVDDDDGYRSWIAANPTGWVVNSYRTPNPGYLVLHRATCRHVSGTPHRGDNWTVEYSKSCGGEAELRAWAGTVLGAEPSLCSHCA